MKANGSEKIAAQNTTQSERPALRIVLCGTTHPGNIGGAARAMKVMGLTRLILVSPKRGIYPSAEATARAVSASDVLDAAQVCDNLAEAVAGCTLVVGTTARERHIGPQVMLPRAFCEQAGQLSNGGEVALVFGRERTGLTNEEVDVCHRLVRIPTQVEFASLNLASAVQILAYEWIQSAAALPPVKPASYEVATSADMEGYMEHLQKVIHLIEFFDGKNQEAILRRLRKIYVRAELDKNEINILRGFLSDVQKSVAERPRDWP